MGRFDGLNSIQKQHMKRTLQAVELREDGQNANACMICHELLREPSLDIYLKANAYQLLSEMSETALAKQYIQTAIKLYQSVGAQDFIEEAMRWQSTLERRDSRDSRHGSADSNTSEVTSEYGSAENARRVASPLTAIDNSSSGQQSEARRRIR